MVAPVIPALNEAEIERILEAGAAAGVREAGYVLLRLPLEVRDVFKEFLEREYPDRAKHVMSVIRSMRGGKDYDSEWGKRMRGDGPYAWQIGRRFEMAARRLGLNRDKLRLRTDLFVPPGGWAGNSICSANGKRPEAAADCQAARVAASCGDPPAEPFRP